MKWTYLMLGGLALGTLTAACDNDPSAEKVKAVSAPAAQPAAAAKQGAVEYKFNNQNSKLAFVGAKVTGKHEGSFETFSGSVQLVEGAPEKSAVKVDVDMASVQVEPEKLEGHLKSPDFFDVAKYPKATFESTSVKPGGVQGATHTVTGNLTLHGVTRSISFPAKIQVSGDNLSVNAEFAINRKDFGIVYPGMPDDLIKDDVLIQLKLGANRS
ncbi:MAG TPA: YceI family protein [Polyangiaceae bacterium]|nr:YceI family protein [Polyangiaceae bacterium]